MSIESMRACARSSNRCQPIDTRFIGLLCVSVQSNSLAVLWALGSGIEISYRTDDAKDDGDYAKQTDQTHSTAQYFVFSLFVHKLAIVH